MDDPRTIDLIDDLACAAERLARQLSELPDDVMDDPRALALRIARAHALAAADGLAELVRDLLSASSERPSAVEHDRWLAQSDEEPAV